MFRGCCFCSGLCRSTSSNCAASPPPCACHHQRAVLVVVDAGVQLLDGDLAQAPGAIDGETVGDECGVGFDAFVTAGQSGWNFSVAWPRCALASKRPSWSRNGQSSRSPETSARPFCSWPPTSAASSHCTTRGGIELRHPESLGHRQRGRVDLGGDVDPRPRSVALPPQPAAGVDAELAAVDAQRRRTDAPAGALAPAADAALQLDRVRHAEAARPVELQSPRRDRASSTNPSASPSTSPASPLHARRVADRPETETVDARARVHRPPRRPTMSIRLQRSLRPGDLDPASQRRRQPVAERRHGQQRRGIDPLGAAARNARHRPAAGHRVSAICGPLPMRSFGASKRQPPPGATCQRARASTRS